MNYESHDHKDHSHDHKALYIHSVMSLIENKAISELDAKISEAKTCDLTQWTRDNSAELFDQYVACCACGNEYDTIKQALIVKDYEKARPLISTYSDHLPQSVELLSHYDFLKSNV